MKLVALFLMRLYPRAWRARYGVEFEALIEDAPPRWSAVLDLLKGAVQMQLSIPNFPRLAVILSLFGLLAGLGASFLVTPRYTSSAAMALSVSPRTPPGSAPANLATHFTRMQDEVLSRTSLSGIIQNPRLDLYKTSRVHTPLEDVIAAMYRDVDIRPVDRAGASRAGWLPFRITFTYSDPHKAQQSIQVFMEKFQDLNLETQRTPMRAMRLAQRTEVESIEARLATLEKKMGIVEAHSGNGPAQVLQAFTDVGGIQLEVVDPPSLPERATFPDHRLFSAVGFGAGLTLAILLAVFRRRVPPPVALQA